jgi:ankyrin repeat protein
MQMNQCNPQTAMAFLNQVRPVLNVPLTPAGQTLLMLATSLSSINLVKAILSYKPDVKLKDSIGRSPLHYAASVGNI